MDFLLNKSKLYKSKDHKPWFRYIGNSNVEMAQYVLDNGGRFVDKKEMNFRLINKYFFVNQLEFLLHQSSTKSNCAKCFACKLCPWIWDY